MPDNMENTENLNEPSLYQEIRDKLKEIIKAPKPSTILLMGEWGSGKTYLIKELMKEINRSQIYLSVARCTSIKEVEELLKEKFLEEALRNEDTKGKVTNFAKKALSLAADVTVKIATSGGAETNFSSSISNRLTEVTIQNAMANSVIYFDDLDRLKDTTLIREILFLGLEYKEEKHCTIVSLSNDQKADIKNDTAYEKLVDRPLRLPKPRKEDFLAIIKQESVRINEIWQETFDKEVEKYFLSGDGFSNLRLYQRFNAFMQEWEAIAQKEKLSKEAHQNISSAIISEIFTQNLQNEDAQEDTEDQLSKDWQEKAKKELQSQKKRVKSLSLEMQEYLLSDSTRVESIALYLAEISEKIREQIRNGYLDNSNIPTLLSGISKYFTKGSISNECVTQTNQLYNDLKITPSKILDHILANFKKYITNATKKEFLSIQDFCFQLNVIEELYEWGQNPLIDTNILPKELSNEEKRKTLIKNWEDKYLNKIEQNPYRLEGFLEKTPSEIMNDFTRIGAPSASQRQNFIHKFEEILKTKYDKSFTETDNLDALSNCLKQLKKDSSLFEKLQNFSSGTWVKLFENKNRTFLLDLWKNQLRKHSFIDFSDSGIHGTQNITFLTYFGKILKKAFYELNKKYPSNVYPIRLRPIYDKLESADKEEYSSLPEKTIRIYVSRISEQPLFQKYNIYGNTKEVREFIEKTFFPIYKNSNETLTKEGYSFKNFLQYRKKENPSDFEQDGLLKFVDDFLSKYESTIEIS